MCADPAAYQLLSPREEAERNKVLNIAHAVGDWVQWLWPVHVSGTQPKVWNGQVQAINMHTEYGLAHVFAPHSPMSASYIPHVPLSRLCILGASCQNSDVGMLTCVAIV